MNILDGIRSPEDLRSLNYEQLNQLCSELRAFLVESVSKTGGHLSSNLGAVELIVAMHRVYDTAEDRLVFDVGHQSYVHKILTGRRDAFVSLRQSGGISGYPKPCESRHDAFIAGHASASISTALGMAHARTLEGKNYDVAALIGDGALTGGLAYEGLCNAGQSGEPIVIILNDNGMSINGSVGGMAKALSHMRMTPRYLNFKRRYREVVGRLPGLYGLFHRVKERLKDILLPHNMFDDMGFYYLGPVNGHDIKRVETALRLARDIRQPVLVHVITEKGKGYAPAESDPETYHGVGAFDPAEGVKKSAGASFSSVFGESLTELAADDKRIAAITAAMTGGTGLTRFACTYPERFFDVGIAEGHGVTMAAGMAKQGMIPVMAVYSTFLQRGYDMLIHDVALQKLHAVFAVDRAGLVGRDGETHQGTFDMSYLGSVPGMTIYCPSSFAELRDMLKAAVLETDGPAAIRYPRGAEGIYTASNAGRDACILRKGTDLTVLAYGIMINQALAAADELERIGVSAEIVKLNVIGGKLPEEIFSSLKKTGRFIAAEDVCAAGCVGRRTLADCAAAGIVLSDVRLLNTGSGIVQHGSVDELMAQCGIDADGIARAAQELMGRNQK